MLSTTSPPMGRIGAISPFAEVSIDKMDIYTPAIPFDLLCCHAI